MNIFEEKTEVNLVFLIILIFIAISWLGLFKVIESWFSHGEWASVQISNSSCLEGSGEDANLFDCERVYFYTLDTNKLIDGKSVSNCKHQVNLLSPGVRYRLEVTNFPFLGKRILNVEKYD